MTEILRIERLHKSFGENEVLHGVDLSVETGETIVILGASGSGKSTLLRCINFMETPTSGRIYLNGVPQGTSRTGRDGVETITYAERDLCKTRAQIGMVFQQFNLFPHMTALQNVLEGPVTVLGKSRKEATELAMAQLSRIGLADKADSYPSHLSGGQQQRVAIARALAMEPAVMLFDEVTSALDPELVGEVLKAIRELSNEGRTLLVVTHELGFAYAVADRILFLHDGRIHEEGTPDQLLLRPRQERTREFLSGHTLFRLPEMAADTGDTDRENV